MRQVALGLHLDLHHCGVGLAGDAVNLVDLFFLDQPLELLAPLRISMVPHKSVYDACLINCVWYFKRRHCVLSYAFNDLLIVFTSYQLRLPLLPLNVLFL